MAISHYGINELSYRIQEGLNVQRKRLMTAGFFYHNDEENGRSVIFNLFELPEPARTNLEHVFMPEYIQNYTIDMVIAVGDTDRAIKALIKQCDAMRRPAVLSPGDQLLLALNISALVLLGALHQSEYNGDSFIWEADFS